MGRVSGGAPRLQPCAVRATSSARVAAAPRRLARAVARNMRAHPSRTRCALGATCGLAAKIPSQTAPGGDRDGARRRRQRSALTKPAPPEDLRTQELDREIETELVQHLV